MINRFVYRHKVVTSDALLTYLLTYKLHATAVMMMICLQHAFIWMWLSPVI